MNKVDIWQLIFLIIVSACFGYFTKEAEVPVPVKWLCWGIILLAWAGFLLGYRL